MTKFGFLLILLLAETLAEEHPDPIIKAVGQELELGYCFAVDYILLYKRTGEGKQLLGNSSNSAGVSPEANGGRVRPTSILNQLLGMKVVDLTVFDSGVYVRECWKNEVLINHQEHYLYVCNEEVSSKQIDSDEGADLVCGANSFGWESATIRWYLETDAGYKTTLFLDTERSLEPLLEEMQGVLQVRDKGFSLHISEEGLKDCRHFTCLIMEGEQCKSFQNIQLPDNSGINIRSVYYSVKERAVLPCLPEHLNARFIYWKTPFGRVNSTTVSKGEMYISMNEDAGNYSLIIPSITSNHSGEYKCSTSLVEYFITVCSELVSDEIHVSGGNKVTLACTSPTKEPTNIQWYRQTEPGLENKLIYDSGDPSLNISANMYIENFSLIITEITHDDGGLYWCVVLLDDSNDYHEELFAEDPEGEAENNSERNYDDYDWLPEEENTDTCFHKQVIQLKVQSKTNIITTTTPQLKNAESGTSQYALIGGGVGILIILIVIAVVIVVVMKLKVKVKATNQNLAESSALQKEPTLSQPFISLKEVNS